MSLYYMNVISTLLVSYIINTDLCARLSATSESAFFNLFEAHYTSCCCVDSEVAANVGTWTSDLSTTSLTNEYFTRVDFLAAKALHAKAGAGVVVDVLA